MNVNAARVVKYAVGVASLTLGIVLTAKANLGVAPVSTFAYALSQMNILTFGLMIAIFHFINILIQFAIQKKFEMKIFLQLIVGVMFWIFIDSFNAIIPNAPDNFLFEIPVLLSGALFMAMGVLMMISANLLNNPPDAVVKMITHKYGFQFGRVKICYDLSILFTTLIITLIVKQRVIGIGLGTLVSATCVGFFADKILRATRHSEILAKIFK